MSFLYTLLLKECFYRVPYFPSLLRAWVFTTGRQTLRFSPFFFFFLTVFLLLTLSPARSVVLCPPALLPQSVSFPIQTSYNIPSASPSLGRPLHFDPPPSCLGHFTIHTLEWPRPGVPLTWLTPWPHQSWQCSPWAGRPGIKPGNMSPWRHSLLGHLLVTLNIPGCSLL